MRKLVLGLMVAGSISVAVPRHASADLPVIDVSSLVAQAKGLFQELKSYTVELQQLQTQLQEVQWLASLATNMIHNPNLGSVMQLANMLGIQPNLPVNPYALQSLVSGYGGINNVNALVGKLSGLGGLVNGSYNTDHIYSCTDNSFTCQQQQATATSDAGVNGVAMQIYTDLTNHVQVLQGLRTQLATSTNAKDTADIQAQIQIEQTWVNNSQGQLQATALLASTQRAVNEEQANEKLNSDIDAVLAAAPK
jgi:hypothetical protein